MKELSWTTCIRAGVTAGAVYLICAGRAEIAALLASLGTALMPLIVGGCIAYAANIPMRALEGRLFPHGGAAARGVCLLATLAAMAAGMAWLAGGILPELLRCVSLLLSGLPELLEGLAAQLHRSGAAAWLSDLPEGWEGVAEQGLTLALQGAGGMLEAAMSTATALLSGVSTAMLSLVFAAYLLAGKERLREQLAQLIRRMLGDGALQRTRMALSALDGAFHAYIVGQCAEALLLGCLCLIGMALLGLPNALTISAMAGATALIPLAGTPIAAAAGAVLLLPEGPAAAVTFAVFFLLLQQVESNFVFPRIVGANLGLSPVWMLTAMLAGGGAFGFAGAMLAVPVAAAVKTLLTRN